MEAPGFHLFLADLVIDLAWRDEKYLRQDGLLTRDESLCQISSLNPQFVNLVSFSTFVLAHKHLSSPSQMSGRVSIDYLILTPTIPCNNNLLLRDGPNCAELASFSLAQPPSAAATTTTLPPPHARIPPKEEVVAQRREERVQRREQEAGEKEKEGESTLPCKPSTPPPALAPGSPQDTPRAPHPPKHRRRRQCTPNASRDAPTPASPPAPVFGCPTPKPLPDDATTEVHGLHRARGKPPCPPPSRSVPARPPAPNPDRHANAPPQARSRTRCPVCGLPTGPRTMSCGAPRCASQSQQSRDQIT
jgi:hypothetical protein